MFMLIFIFCFLYEMKFKRRHFKLGGILTLKYLVPTMNTSGQKRALSRHKRTLFGLIKNTYLPISNMEQKIKNYNILTCIFLLRRFPRRTTTNPWDGRTRVAVHLRRSTHWGKFLQIFVKLSSLFACTSGVTIITRMLPQQLATLSARLRL